MTPYSARRSRAAPLRLLVSVAPWLALAAWFLSFEVVPAPLRTLAIGLVVLAWIALGAAVVRLLTMRLRIRPDGALRIDRMAGSDTVDLTRLRRISLDPDRPWYTGDQPPGIPLWRPPHLVLEDGDGRTARLPLGDQWGPPGPLFARVLEVVDSVAPATTPVARAELRFIVGSFASRPSS